MNLRFHIAIFKHIRANLPGRSQARSFTGIVTSLVCCFLAIASHAQDVVITQMALQPDGNVVLKYNLADDRLDRKFSLYLYSSVDDFIQPLAKVSGDIGIGVQVGGNKTVTWHAKEEMGDTFKGSIALELKGNIYIPFIALDNFDDYKVLKRGKEYEVTWTGGRGDNVLLFELYDSEDKIKVFEERPNVGNTTIIIPKDVKAGEYRFKISDSRNRDEVVFTQNFRVKAQIPFVVKAGLGLVVLGGVGYLASAGGSDGAGSEPKIVDPPLPDN